MTALGEQFSIGRRNRGSVRDAPNGWIVPSLVFVLAAVAGWRDGGFWHAEAAAIAVIAAVLLVAALITAPPDRRDIFVLSSLGLLALWWFIRTATAGPGADFLPLGASIIAFAAAFAAVRPLGGRARELAALAIVCLGAVGALVGLVGLIGRWSPLALPAQGLWRLSSSLTYADAAGLAFGVCLLVALGCGRAPALVRIAVCLNTAGLIAAQSRGAFVAVVCACLLVPARRYRELGASAHGRSRAGRRGRRFVAAEPPSSVACRSGCRGDGHCRLGSQRQVPAGAERTNHGRCSVRPSCAESSEPRCLCITRSVCGPWRRATTTGPPNGRALGTNGRRLPSRASGRIER